MEYSEGAKRAGYDWSYRRWLEREHDRQHAEAVKQVKQAEKEDAEHGIQEIQVQSFS